MIGREHCMQASNARRRASKAAHGQTQNRNESQNKSQTESQSRQPEGTRTAESTAGSPRQFAGSIARG